jgi:hypothetical protein
MASRLGDDDRRAVDLVLDRLDGEQPETMAQPPPPTPQRVQSVEKILSLLERMPAYEPPPDLAAKTLHRIDQALAALNAPPVQNLPQREPRPPI